MTDQYFRNIEWQGKEGVFLVMFNRLSADNTNIAELKSELSKSKLDCDVLPAPCLVIAILKPVNR